MEMNKCMMVVMLFVAVSQAERIDLSEAVVGTPKYFPNIDYAGNVGNVRNLLNGDENHNSVTGCLSAAYEKNSKAYFQLDMLREVEVVSVELLSWKDYPWKYSQFYDFEIHVSKEVDANASNLCATQTGEGDTTQLNIYKCSQPMKGRYISFIAIDYLNLCEIRVNGELVSPDSFVDMSTAVVDSGPTLLNYPTDRMNDGDLSQDFDTKCTAVTNDENEDNAIWIEIDMGSVQTIGSVELLPRYDTVGVDQLKDFSIYLAKKDQTSVSNLCAVAGNKTSLIEWNTYRCQHLMQGQYLTIRKNSAETDYISICEIKVNTKGSLNDKVEGSGSSGDVEVSGSSRTCVRKKQCMAKTR